MSFKSTPIADVDRGSHQPFLPEPAQVHNAASAIDAMNWLQHALNTYPQRASAAADITGLNAENRDLTSQILGEGEVSAQYRGKLTVKMQESVLAGVWRTLCVDDENQLIRDLVEVGDVPALARLAGGALDLPPLGDLEAPPGVINAVPLLAEISPHLAGYEPGQSAHIINLTLLPVSPEDLEFLDQTLAIGPVSILSRGYGDCRITSTGYQNVWWVRYYNSTGKLILNTLEVVDIPTVACAAPEDLQSSAERLQHRMEPYRNAM